MYELKGGEYILGDKLYGWTGAKCRKCKGAGEDNDARRCPDCAGTGEEHGVMPEQPKNLGSDTL